ncbi:MAG: sigma-54 dependent transcriptional regulator, partial [Syntrophomonadaceae bacterium]|nr:sigma-54 dependent transcriptional regulator [Syntrophomonadaceae bacterium]
MNILLVEDEVRSRQYVARFLTQLGHHVVEAGDGEEALRLVAEQEFHLVFTDNRMPRMSGLEFLRRLRQDLERPDMDVILVTAFGDMETAVEALRAGAYDYLLKPVNIEELVAVTERVAEHQALRREHRVLSRRFEDAVRAATEETVQELSRLKQAYYQVLGLGRIGVFSPAMAQVMEQARRLHADRSVPVLICGETGTGKEVVARSIHYGDGSVTAPFVAVNCAALAPTVFESELFGYEGGAFTGGLPKGQKGKLDLAQGGTLFLDEISEIPVDLQAKLLRVIQEREFYRVGGLKK